MGRRQEGKNEGRKKNGRGGSREPGIAIKKMDMLLKKMLHHAV
jgi:hypothetical protein